MRNQVLCEEIIRLIYLLAERRDWRITDQVRDRSDLLVAVAFISVVGYTVFFLIPAVRGIAKIPHRLFVFAEYFVGHERAKNFEVVAQERARTFSLAAASILRREALPLILKTAGLTVIQVLLSGLALWSILTAAGLKIDPLSSTLIAGGTSAIAAIPITIGGSGVVELTMLSYLSSVYGFSSWAAIVLWRVASYQVVLAVTGIAFLILTHRSTKAGVPKHGAENADVGHLEPPLSNTSQKTGSDIGASSARRFTADEVESEVVKLKTRFGVVKAIRFAIAGAVGFGVTEVVLTVGLLILFGNIPHARSASPALLGLDVLSLVIGVSAAFFINERITVHVPKSVKGEAADMFKRLLKFQAVSGIGNAGIIVVQLVLLATIDVSPVLGTVIGAAVTYPIVYYISIKYVWEAYRTR